MTRAQKSLRACTAGVIISVFIGFVLLSFPVDKYRTGRVLDFSEFYAAGTMVRDGLGHRLYDLRLQAQYQWRDAAIHAFYLRPPFEALLFVPFSYLTYRAAYSVWVLISLVFLASSAILIERQVHVSRALTQYTRGIPVDTGLILVLFLTFGPTMNCFLIGQDTMLLLLIYTLSFILLKNGNPFAAGCVLALGLFKYHLVIPFVIVFLIRRQWVFLKGFTLVGAILVAVSVAIGGFGVFNSYPQVFFNSTYQEVIGGFQPQYAANIRGFTYLICGAFLPGYLILIIVAALSGVMLWAAAKRWSDDALEYSFAAGVIASLATGIHLFFYDLSLLLLPIAIICAQLAREGKLLRNHALSVTLIILFVPPFHRLLIVHAIYALMFIPAFTLFLITLNLLSNHCTVQPDNPPGTPRVLAQ
ncbi:MAG: glycosyltransferase family 87 protein [Candidatus Sulfotelmatobacter sp.]